MNKSKRNLIVGLLVAFVIGGLAIYTYGEYTQEESNKQDIVNTAITRAQNCGLKDVEVVITGKTNMSGYSWYNYNVECSNFDEYSHSQMISIAKELGSVGGTSNRDSASLSKIISNGDSYTIYASTRSIYKNGEQVYDDYWNSETHESAQNNKGGNSSNSSNSKDGVICKSCGRTFKKGSENAKSITRTNMCTNCYNNFKTATDALNELPIG